MRVISAIGYAVAITVGLLGIVAAGVVSMEYLIKRDKGWLLAVLGLLIFVTILSMGIYPTLK